MVKNPELWNLLHSIMFVGADCATFRKFSKVLEQLENNADDETCKKILDELVNAMKLIVSYSKIE